MREILFRGKRIDNGEWAEGYFVHCKSDFDEESERTAEIISNNADRIYKGEYSPFDVCEAILETVGQFIGVTDRNGKKIFEGDLLNGFQYPFYRSESAEHNYFAEVIWFTENCAFGLYTHKHPTAKVRGISAGNADFIEDFNSDDWEVIGNIYDNPELLEG